MLTVRLETLLPVKLANPIVVNVPENDWLLLCAVGIGYYDDNDKARCIDIVSYAQSKAVCGI